VGRCLGPAPPDTADGLVGARLVRGRRDGSIDESAQPMLEETAGYPFGRIQAA
jgi:hypothetical protein